MLLVPPSTTTKLARRGIPAPASGLSEVPLHLLGSQNPIPSYRSMASLDAASWCCIPGYTVRLSASEVQLAHPDRILLLPRWMVRECSQRGVASKRRQRETEGFCVMLSLGRPKEWYYGAKLALKLRSASSLQTKRILEGLEMM